MTSTIYHYSCIIVNPKTGNVHAYDYGCRSFDEPISNEEDYRAFCVWIREDTMDTHERMGNEKGILEVVIQNISRLN